MILNNIPVEYKQFILNILSTPEIKELLEDNDVEGFYKALRHLPTKTFNGKIRTVYDSHVQTSQWGGEATIKINGKDVKLATNEHQQLYPSDVKALITQIITEMLKEINNPLVSRAGYAPAQFKGDTSITTFKVDPDITEIPAKCFEDCTNLKSIDLGNVKVIKDLAFANCQSLEEIVFPASVERIYGNAFAWTKNIKKITVMNPNIKIGNSAFPYSDFEEIVTTNPKKFTEDKLGDYTNQPYIIYETNPPKQNPYKASVAKITKI